MINIYLIRHGKASSGWDTTDPNLDLTGKKQSDKIALKLSQIAKEPFDVFSSPLNRCIETASLALEKQYLEIEINDNFRELPSPTIDLEKRVDWLRRILPLTWPELLKDNETMESGVDFIQWKENIMSNIYSLKKDTIIFTHFVVINAVIGEILKSDKIINFQPSNCSITEISKINHKLKIVKLGKSLESKVN